MSFRSVKRELSTSMLLLVVRKQKPAVWLRTRLGGWLGKQLRGGTADSSSKCSGVFYCVLISYPRLDIQGWYPGPSNMHTTCCVRAFLSSTSAQDPNPRYATSSERAYLLLRGTNFILSKLRFEKRNGYLAYNHLLSGTSLDCLRPCSSPSISPTQSQYSSHYNLTFRTRSSALLPSMQV